MVLLLRFWGRVGVSKNNIKVVDDPRDDAAPLKSAAVPHVSFPYCSVLVLTTPASFAQMALMLMILSHMPIMGISGHVRS